jgi:hypothetical protein
MQVVVIAPVRRGEQAGQGNGFGVGDEFDAVLGGAVGVSVGVLGDGIQASGPALPESEWLRRSEPVRCDRAGAQVVQGDERGLAAADESVVPQVGVEYLGEHVQVMLVAAV